LTPANGLIVSAVLVPLTRAMVDEDRPVFL
jgi:hypothetical protein